MADAALVATGAGNAPLSYLVPGATAIRIKQVHVQYVDNGAGGDWLPAVKIVSDSKHLMGTAADQAVKVTAGSDADVSFFPLRRRRVAGSGLTLDYNLGEIGNIIETNLNNFAVAPIQYQNINAGDGILVLAAAPTVQFLGETPAHPTDVFDVPGNTYTPLGSFAFEANPPGVNVGMYVTLFWCPSGIATQVAGVDFLEVDWDGNVFDRIIEIWSVRHSGGAHTPTVLAATPDHDAATFASANVTMVAPNYTPARDQGLEFALVCAARAGGLGGFGGVAGFSGFFQAEFRSYTGSKQSYVVNPQTAGANAYLIAGAVPAPYEDDVGVLPGGVLVPSFSGVGVHFLTGTNAWKGIILLGLD
jgi:hypothetical protein